MDIGDWAHVCIGEIDLCILNALQFCIISFLQHHTNFCRKKGLCEKTYFSIYSCFVESFFRVLCGILDIGAMKIIYKAAHVIEMRPFRVGYILKALCL